MTVDEARQDTRSGHGALFGRLFDDAAIFPPGQAPMETALTRHLAWRSSPESDFVGPFICASPRWVELVSCLPRDASIPVSVTVPTGVGAVESAVRAAEEEPRTSLVSVEVPVTPEESLDQALTVLDAVLPPETVGFVELPWVAVDGVSCDLLARSRHRLKVRTGGTAAESFPSEELLAGMIWRTVRSGVAFKLTAGLHHAVRHRDAETGFEHHGFLNVIAATAAAGDDADVPAVQSVLATQDPGQVADLVRRLDGEATRDVRQQFLSFGTCSIEEPLEDLNNLGLLKQPSP
jgi:hypothetical protein